MSKYRHSRTLTTARKGASAVEFAVIAPILLVVVFGMVETSRFMMALHATTGAAREAVRIAAVSADATDEEIEETARTYMQNSYFRTDSITVEIDEASANVDSMKNLSCTVSIAFEDVSVIGNPFSLTVSNVTGNASMMTADDN